MINGFHFLVFTVVVFGAVYWIPRAIRYDAWAFEMDNLDDNAEHHETDNSNDEAYEAFKEARNG